MEQKTKQEKWGLSGTSFLEGSFSPELVPEQEDGDSTGFLERLIPGPRAALMLLYIL